MDSLTQTTMKQYESCLKGWWCFATNKNINVFEPNITDVMEYLTLKFHGGAKYGTLNSTRAAISLICKNDLSKNPLLSRFLRGCYKRRPSQPKYSVTWDTEQVLSYIKNISDLRNLKLKEHCEILTTLLILITAHRLQTLAMINIDNIIKTNSGFKIKIPDLIKTSKPGKEQPVLSIPFLKQDKEVCVATILLQYLEKTEELRGSGKNLFISTVKPHGPASAQTLGHWVKSLLVKAGVDVNVFTAYSTKHAAVSKAFTNGVDINTIRRTAGWSSTSSTFARFYNREIQDSDDTFARSILLNT